MSEVKTDQPKQEELKEIQEIDIEKEECLSIQKLLNQAEALTFRIGQFEIEKDRALNTAFVIGEKIDKAVKAIMLKSGILEENFNKYIVDSQTMKIKPRPTENS